MGLREAISEMIKARGRVVLFCGDGYRFRKIVPVNDDMVDDVMEAIRYEKMECRELYVAIRADDWDEVGV